MLGFSASNVLNKGSYTTQNTKLVFFWSWTSGVCSPGVCIWVLAMVCVQKKRKENYSKPILTILNHAFRMFLNIDQILVKLGLYPVYLFNISKFLLWKWNRYNSALNNHKHPTYTPNIEVLKLRSWNFPFLLLSILGFFWIWFVEMLLIKAI